MSKRTPNFSKGDSVTYQKMVGKVIKVWTITEGNYKYTVQFADGKRVILEGQLKRS